MAIIFRQISSNMRSSQLENLFQPVCKGGLGFPQPSAIFLEKKQTVLNRMPVDDLHTRLAVEGLQYRAHHRYDGNTPCTPITRDLSYPILTASPVALEPSARQSTTLCGSVLGHLLPACPRSDIPSQRYHRENRRSTSPALNCPDPLPPLEYPSSLPVAPAPQ